MKNAASRPVCLLARADGLMLLAVWLMLQEMGGTTAEIMGHLIMLRADRMAISITVNSIGTPLNEVHQHTTQAYTSPWAATAMPGLQL